MFGFEYDNEVGLAGVGVHGPIPNTAHNQANLWANYDFNVGLKLGAGINYISTRLAGSDALLVPGTVSIPSVPGYTTLDGMVGYRINGTLSLQLNGFNLTDKFYFINSYFTRPNENHTIPGPGRTFLLTARVSL